MPSSFRYGRYLMKKFVNAFPRNTVICSTTVLSGENLAEAVMDTPPKTPETPRGDKLATNIVHFARTLRTAGLRVGPGQVLRAIEAVEAAGLRKRDDFYWTLHSVFVNRRDQREIFDQAFHVYWRNPRILEKMMDMLLPQVGVPAEQDK